MTVNHSTGPVREDRLESPGGPTEETRPEASSGTVSRALQLLAVIADMQGSVSVKYIAEQMRLAPSTAHRLLNLLKAEGFVDATTEGRQYVVGPQFYRVAARVMNTVSPRVIAQPVIEAIADAFSETVLFGIYQPAQQAMSFAGRADGQQKLRYEIAMDRPLSLVWGASGKAILAYLDKDTIVQIVNAETPSPVTNQSVPDIETLETELATIRRHGYAVTDGEKLPDARGIAAPVFGPKGVMGCICLTSPKTRMPHGDIHAIGTEIVARAAALSRNLGASPK